jgi:VWFA-related protein
MVLVDVVVRAKSGDYLPDLAARDFRIWEDNKEQTIRSFSLETDSSAAEPRRLVLFFDNIGLSATEQASARQAAAGFIDANAGPNRLMAVVSFDGGFHLLQSFTGDADALKRAVAGARPFTASNSGGTRISDAPEAASRARGLIQSVASLARNLNAVPGRKIIVLLTGQPSISAAQESDVTSLVQIGNRSNVAVYPVLQAGGTEQDSPDTQAVVGVPRGRSAPRNPVVDSQQQDDSLAFAIARGTGGFVASRSNDILAELQKIGAEQNQYYVLGFTPPDSKEGICHALRVKVDRSGAAMRVRSSYCSAKPQDLLAKSRVEQDLEKHAAAVQTGSTVSIQTPFFYATPGMARVHVVMEIPTDQLKFENQKGKLHAEVNVLGIASAANGDVAARFSDIVKRDFENKSDLHYEKEFKIAPGQYHLTVVFSSGGAAFGKVETPLAIGAWDQSTFAVSGLALSKAVHPASELGFEASLIDEGTPLIAGGMQVIPTGSNKFTRSQQAFCYFEVYPPLIHGNPATVALRVLDVKTGVQKWDGGAVKLDPPPAGKSAIPFGLSVPIASLPPSTYQIEVTAGSSRRTVDFEIK